MKTIFLFLATLMAIPGFAAAEDEAVIDPGQVSPAGGLFRQDWLRGYGTFEFALPANEPDLGRCAANTSQFGGSGAPCADFARYMLSSYVEVQPFNRTLFSRLFFFAVTKFSMGNNLPAVSYTAGADPIACENLFGAGIELPKKLELRVVDHSVHWMGRYTGGLGPADLSSGGPYGLYATVGLRWYFGDAGYVRRNTAPAPAPRHEFFPREALRGYVTAEYAPKANEPDLGRCVSGTGAFGGVAAPCADYARYMLSGYVEAQPFAHGRLGNVYFFDAPRFSLGNNVPQVSYTNAADPIACENVFGIGIRLPRNFELRVARHAVYWLGRYGSNLGAADLGTSGPYGSYTTVGVRWYLGAPHEFL